MESLLKKNQSKSKVCDNLMDINTSCSLSCRFGYEPSNLDTYLKAGGTACTKNGNIEEKVGLRCKKKVCKKSDFDAWITKEGKKKSVASVYSNTDTSHCFKNNTMTRGKICDIQCNHMAGYDRRLKINKQNIPVEEIKCSDGKFVRVKKKHTNTRCYQKTYPKLKDFPCLRELDEYINQKGGSLLHTKESCIHKQSDDDYGYCYHKKKLEGSHSKKNIFYCMKETIKQNNKTKDVYKLGKK